MQTERDAPYELSRIENDENNTPWVEKPYIVFVVYENEHGGADSVVATKMTINDALEAAQHHSALSISGYYEILNLKTNKYIGLNKMDLSDKERFKAVCEKYKNF